MGKLRGYGNIGNYQSEGCGPTRYFIPGCDGESGGWPGSGVSVSCRRRCRRIVRILAFSTHSYNFLGFPVFYCIVLVALYVVLKGFEVC